MADVQADGTFGHISGQGWMPWTKTHSGSDIYRPKFKHDSWLDI